MKRIALLAALAGTSGLAQADVSLYGSLHGGLLSNRTTTAAESVRQNQVDDFESVIGFKGEEALGNGLKAIWQVEQRLAMDGNAQDGANQFAGKESFIGLEGDFGTVRLGNLLNSHDSTQAPDIFAGPDTTQTALRLDTYRRTGGERSNSMRYDSPAFDGLSFNAIYSAGENRSSTNATPSDAWGAGVRYEFGAWFAQYAHETLRNAQRDPGNTPSNKARADRVEFGFAGEELNVALGLQQTRGWGWGEANAGDSDARTRTREAAISASYQLGAFTPKTSFAKGLDRHDHTGKIDNSGYRHWIVGVDYALSKRTNATLAYGQLRYDDNAGVNENVSGAALRKASTCGLSLVHSF